ncbi:unnamed protein product [Clonostachys rosea]|uniref:Heterokaryon incompatibility domain-containing protein n=1 Tax=Bionectria ochroleuca TaxID=29856 RepID=A0ABY6UL46_BIOOC|nr:unnamed protein product [Clonostachys rosea]
MAPFPLDLLQQQDLRIKERLLVYRPLDSSVEEIRVLKLSPADHFGAPINCTLAHLQLNSDTIEEYEALSYVWDEPELVHTITLNGQPHRITTNLELALRFLRSAKRERTLWVDALCVDQTNLSERNTQTQLMKEIYSRSKVVLAWLPTVGSIVSMDDVGWSSDGRLVYKEKARSNLRIIGEAMQLTKKICLQDYGTLLQMHANFLSVSEGFDPHAGHHPEESMAAHAESRYMPIEAPFVLNTRQSELMRCLFVNPPLWNRLWIMQEMALGRQLVLVAGYHELSWHFITLFLKNVAYANSFYAFTGGYARLPKLLNYVFAIPLKIEHQRRIQRKLALRKCLPSTLLDVLMRFAESKASDPRDYIYGVLGLVNDRLRIQANYFAPPAILFTETALAIINSAQNLDLLCQTAWRPRHDSDGALLDSAASNRLEGLPTWVPDFANNLLYTKHETTLFGQEDIFTASEPNIGGFRVSHQKYLGVMATIIAKVPRPVAKEKNDIMRKGLYSMEIYPRGTAAPVWNSELRQWLTKAGLDLESLERRELYTQTGETLVRALWRTLTTDCEAYPICRNGPYKWTTTDNLLYDILSGHPKVSAYDDFKMGYWSAMSTKHREMILRNSQHWTFAVVSNGLFTMMQQAQPGDVIACVRGARVPLILRPTGKLVGRKDVYSYVGTAYVHGFMDGEAPNMVRGCQLSEEGVLLN